MDADFPMILHESTLFSRACKPTSLGIVPCQVTAKASAHQTPWYVPWFVAPQGRLGGDGRGVIAPFPNLTSLAVDTHMGFSLAV
jgi:hypothetical protein